MIEFKFNYNKRGKKHLTSFFIAQSELVNYFQLELFLFLQNQHFLLNCPRIFPKIKRNET